MQHWLLVRGRGDEPLPARGFTLDRHSSTRRPTVQRGDLAVCYASVWQAVFAVVEVLSDPEENPGRSRWRWSFGLRPVVALDDLDRAIPCEEVGVFPSSLWRHSYIRLTAEQFERAREAIATRAGGAAAGPARAGRRRLPARWRRARRGREEEGSGSACLDRRAAGATSSPKRAGSRATPRRRPKPLRRRR